MGTASASESVELLGCVEASAQSRRPAGPSSATRRRARRILAVGMVAYLALALITAVADRGRARIQPIDTSFSDPFVADWAPLTSSTGSGGDYDRPPPMVAVDVACVGFGRVDWSPAKRSPSVAHCAEPAAVARLEGRDVAVLRESIAGDRTWYFLVFGAELDGIEIRIDGVDDLGQDWIFQTDRYAALLLPNGHDELSLRWTLANGDVHQCQLEAGSIADQKCS